MIVTVSCCPRGQSNRGNHALEPTKVGVPVTYIVRGWMALLGTTYMRGRIAISGGDTVLHYVLREAFWPHVPNTSHSSHPDLVLRSECCAMEGISICGLVTFPPSCP